MERLQKSMTIYVKSLSKRSEAEDKEKTLPVAYLGSTMVAHGDDFEPDSEFGQCLSGLGRANERIGRMQESYVANATSSWLESLERSLAQMKEYQVRRLRNLLEVTPLIASSTGCSEEAREQAPCLRHLASKNAKVEEGGL